MQEQLDELTLTLINIYNKNLEFLKKDYPEIFKKVTTLSQKIENQQYKEKYSLEYKEDGYFDIYNHEKKEYLYGFNSYIEADKRKELNNFTQDSSINLLRIDTQTEKLALMKSLAEGAILVNYLNQIIDFKKVTFSKIYKFIFIGVGAGVHIHEVHKKINSMNTLIIEPNLEIFRLSLFLVDYSIFKEGNKELYLSIDENKNEMNSTLLEFSTDHEYMNYNIKHHLFHPDYKYILDNIIEYYAINNPMSFPYHASLKAIHKTIDFMKKEYNFIHKNLLDKAFPLKKKKILLISAGPSLDNHLEWIYKNQDKFVIICVDVILRKLEKNRIVPDIVVSIDPSELCADYLTTEDKNFLQKSSIIFLSQQNEKTIEAVKHCNFYFSQSFLVSKEIGYSASMPNVGTFSFMVAILLGGEELYLTGCDAAFNQQTGERYAKDSSHSKSDSIEHNSNISDTISIEDVVEVKGNLRETVKSNRELLGFRDTYERLIHSLDDNFKAFNLSDGAYIDGIIPLEIKDINIDNFENKEFDPIQDLEKICKPVEDLKFGEDEKELNAIISKIKKFKKLKIKNKDDLIKNKIDLTIWILEEQKKLNINVFATIFLKFIELTDIYINFVLNIKQENLHKKENLNRINIYWCDSLLSLLKDMKEAVRSN